MPTDLTAVQRTEPVYLTDSAGNTVTVTSNRLIVDGSGVTQPVGGVAAAGAAVSGNPVLLGGSDGANVRTLLATSAGVLQTMPGILVANSATTWNSATALNTTFRVYNTNAGSVATLVNFVPSGGTFTTGQVTFEQSFDSVNFSTVAAAQVVDPNTLAQVAIPYTFLSATTKNFLLIANGAQLIRAKLSTAITGTGSVVLSYAQLGYNPENALNAAGALLVDGSAVTQPVNLTQVGGTNVVTGGVAGSQGVGGLAANAATLVGNPVLMAGSDGTNARSLSVDSSGKLNVNASAAAASDTTASGTLGAGGAVLAVALAGQQTAQFSLPTGNNLVGTLQFLCSFDGGTTYVSNGVQWRTVFSAFGPFNNAASVNATVSSTQEWYEVIAPAGASHVQVKVATYTSGTVTASARSVASQGVSISVLADQVSTGTISGAGQSISVPVTGGYNTMTVVLPAATTLIATIVFESSYDNGTTWAPSGGVAPARLINSSYDWIANATLASGQTRTFEVLILPGVTNIRIRDTAFTSGSGTFTCRLCNTPQTNELAYGMSLVGSSNAPNLLLGVRGAAASGNVNDLFPVMVGGFDATNGVVWSLATTTTGVLKVDASSNTVPITGTVIVTGNALPGAAASSSPVPVSGVDSATKTRSLLTDSQGRLLLGPGFAPNIVQKISNVSSGSVASLVKAFAATTLAGNSIVVVCAVGNTTAPTCSDGTNTYKAVTSNQNTSLGTAIFLASNIAGGNVTVTVSNGGATASMAMEIYEVQGLLAFNTQQADSSNAVGGTFTNSTVQLLPTVANGLAFVGVGISSAQTITATSPFVTDSGTINPTTPSGLFAFNSASIIFPKITSAQAQAATTFTFGASVTYSLSAALFYPVPMAIGGCVGLTDQSGSVLPIIPATSAIIAQAALPIGGFYNTSLPVISNTHGTPFQTDVNANLLITPAVTTAGGCSTFTTSIKNVVTAVKASAGNLYGFAFGNGNSAAVYVQLFDLATGGVTLGTTAPKLSYLVPAGQTLNIDFTRPISFATAISVACTTSRAGSGAPTSSVDLNFHFF